ncbi:MAG: pilus assembly protein PilC [Planctomycetota bacterium]|nr:MAG: pilus assembly protein PilC [Planctomycetota bacterium]
MALFNYEALDRAGKLVKGELEAGTRDEAIKKIKAMGQFPKKISTKSGGGKAGTSGRTSVKIRATRKSAGRVGARYLTLFTRQFSTLNDAGLPIVKSLDILSDKQESKNMHIALTAISEDVSSGKSLSDALKEHPKIFDNFYVNMVKAGEIAGVLDIIFSRLADFREKAAKLKNKVITAMAYPAFVCSFASFILLGIMIFIIPLFRKMFKDMGQKSLPPMTEIVCSISDFLISPSIFFLFIGGIVVTFLYFASQKSPQIKYFTDMIKNRIPILGTIRRKAGVAIFCRTLGTLIQSGVSILEALNIIKLATRDSLIVEDIERIYNSIREGESIADPIRESKVFDALVADMVAVGEETGEIDKMLLKIADNYDEEVDQQLERLMSLIEPIMIVGMAVVIGTIVIALFLPMIGMMDGIGGN